MTIFKKDYLYTLLAAFGVAMFLALIVFAGNPATRASANGQSLGCVDSTNFIASTSPGYGADCSAQATTTPDYLSLTASTTVLSANTGMASAVDVNLYEKAASSTGSVVLLTAWVSNDNINWYPITNNSTGAIVAYTWTPWGSAAASTTNIHIGNLNQKYLQVREQAATASSSIYTQLIIDNQIIN